jgi:type IV pilus assembly protein PilV
MHRLNTSAHIRASAQLRSAKGLGLIEVLVALVVISIGLLGTASMFAQSIRNSHAALIRTQAVNLAADMAERIRANSGAQDAYTSDVYAGSANEQGCAAQVSVPARDCTAEELAEDDIAHWREEAIRSLPRAHGLSEPEVSVEFVEGASSADPARYRISLAWAEPGEQLPLSYSTELMLLAPKS